MLRREVDGRTRRSKPLWLFLALLAALLIAVYTFESIAGGGHPSQRSAPLLGLVSNTDGISLAGAIGPRLPADAPVVHWPAGIPAGRYRTGFTDRQIPGRGGPRAAIVALLIYASAQVAAHFVLNLQSVNLRLIRHENPAVSIAAVHRIRESGNAAAVPALQQDSRLRAPGLRLRPG